MKPSFKLVVEDHDAAGKSGKRYTTASQLREEEERSIRRARRITYCTYAGIAIWLATVRLPMSRDY